MMDLLCVCVCVWCGVCRISRDISYLKQTPENYQSEHVHSSRCCVARPQLSERLAAQKLADTSRSFRPGPSYSAVFTMPSSVTDQLPLRRRRLNRPGFNRFAKFRDYSERALIHTDYAASGCFRCPSRKPTKTLQGSENQEDMTPRTFGEINK